MDNSLLKQILHEYELKRNIAIEDANIRKKALLLVNPRLSEIEDELASISIKTAKAIILAEDKEKTKLLSDLKKQTSNLLKEKNIFLKTISNDSNYLNPHFECNLCKDTGYVFKNNNTCMCNCFKQRIYDVAYNKSNMGNLERENFSTFNIRLFSDKPNNELYKSEISPRQNINLIKEKVKIFIDNFDNPAEKNLLFTGNTGLGKTFLTNCIASEMLKKGKTVLYQTAPVMLDSIIDAKFGKENSSATLLDNILNVDLLIIDDLGTETPNTLKITELFTIINTRLLNQNHKITKTIISTNLTVAELNQIYTSRICSRIVGYYTLLRFFGEDLRFKKLKQSSYNKKNEV